MATSKQAGRVLLPPTVLPVKYVSCCRNGEVPGCVSPCLIPWVSKQLGWTSTTIGPWGATLKILRDRCLDAISRRGRNPNGCWLSLSVPCGIGGIINPFMGIYIMYISCIYNIFHVYISFIYHVCISIMYLYIIYTIILYIYCIYWYSTDAFWIPMGWTMAEDIKLKPDLANFTFEGSEVICAMAMLDCTGSLVIVLAWILDHLYLAESSYLSIYPSIYLSFFLSI